MAQAADQKHWLDPPDWWRRARPLRWLIVVGVAVWAISYFDLLRFVKLPERVIPSFLKRDPHPETGFYTRIEADRVKMLDRFQSYDDVGAVTKILSSAGYEGWTASSRHSPMSSAYPPYDFDSIRVEGYKHLGVNGRLTLSFFNNRLFEAEFDPENAEVYSRKLLALDLKPSRDENARAERVDGDLRVLSTVDLALSPVGRSLHTEPFVIWQDLRLIHARAAWDSKFGGIPMATEGG